MIKLRLNPVFILTLITTFLCLQWASAHVHISSNHAHNNQNHQHQLQNHSHSLSKHFNTHHADAIDIALSTDDAHSPNHSKTVDLDPECSTPSTHHKTPVLAITAAYYQLRITPNIASQQIIARVPHKVRFLDQSTLNPRAPPVYL